MTTGTVLRVSRRGILVRASQAPKIGQDVFAGKRKRVGTVSEMFGPVASPYVVVKPASGLSAKEVEGLVGSNVMMGEETWKRKKSR
ncbi:MAG: hypothetical protein QW567_04660 [Candidatus Hadarchaeales archaeon]